jgi:hypothetical protein
MAFDAGDLTVCPEAAALLHLVSDLSERTLRDLERLLLADLATPSGAELREARLGLLMEMVSDGSGQIARADVYDALREHRQALGERWPDSTTLIRAYSQRWAVAVRAAMRLAFDGGAQRVAHTHKHGQGRRDYTREEVVTAVRRFHEQHDGRWPAATQFYAWGEYLRRAARNGGHPDPRVPTRPALRKKFPRFSLAVAAAKLASDRRGAGP